MRLEDELVMRFEEEPLRPAWNRAVITAQFVENVGEKIQNDHPQVLTDDVMAYVVSLAYMSNFPLLRDTLVDAESSITDAVVFRAYTHVRTALMLFNQCWLTHTDIATDDDWDDWIKSMSTPIVEY